MEGLRFAATDILTMDLEDLQVLVIGRPDRDDCDAFLYDPMPGGSGLLDQLCERFPEVIAKAAELATGCPGRCVASCIDCFQTYRNASYHKYLDRTVLAERIREWGSAPCFEHDIPPKQPASAPSGDEQPVNEAERRLRTMLLAAGFPEGRWQDSFLLPRPLGSTMPDVTYDDPLDEERKIFIYLDGLSNHIHGNPITRSRDVGIRNELRSLGHEVLEIPYVHLTDQQNMIRHFKRLARFMVGPEAMTRVSDEATTWFAGERAGAPPILKERPFHSVPITPETAWTTCVPLMTLHAAAGKFSEEQAGFDQFASWAEDWINWPGAPRFEKGMFVAQVMGKSMEPDIPDGAYCLFCLPRAGSRQGRTVLVSHSDVSDPHTGGRYTVKVYESEKMETATGGWQHVRIVLKPKNPEFQPIILEPTEEGRVRVIAEFVQIVG